MARGLSRGEQGKHDLALEDLAQAGRLFANQGDSLKADQLLEASAACMSYPTVRQPTLAMASALLCSVAPCPPPRRWPRSPLSTDADGALSRVSDRFEPGRAKEP